MDAALSPPLGKFAKYFLREPFAFQCQVLDSPICQDQGSYVTNLREKRASKNSSFAIVLGSAVAGGISVIGTYVTVQGVSSLTFVLALALVGMLVGGLVGIWAGDKSAKMVGVGAFIGVFIIWLPVVAVTYGFALLALPLLLLYALIMAIGSKFANMLRKRL